MNDLDRMMVTLDLVRGELRILVGKLEQFELAYQGVCEQLCDLKDLSRRALYVEGVRDLLGKLGDRLADRVEGRTAPRRGIRHFTF